jgi:carbon-monoxide dehydrogenase large subunit
MNRVLTQDRYVGQPMRRREDFRLLVGRGQYIADMKRPGTLAVTIVRSEHAHARLRSVDAAAAREHPGVVAIFSGTDLDSHWREPLPCIWPVNEDMRQPDHWPLARDKVRHAGEAVAVIVADSVTAGVDAAELINVEYDVLPVVTDVAAALDPEAPLVHDEFGTNECYRSSFAFGPVEESFATAAVTVKCRFRQQRLIPVPIEPRGVLVEPSDGRDAFTVYSSTQVPHLLRTGLASMFDIPESALRVVAPDVGGGFGAKLNFYAEEAICLALARLLRRPVKWVQTRSDDFVSTTHARDLVQEIELAATEDGKILAVRTRLQAAMGAYLQLYTPGIPLCGAALYSGCYDPVAYDFDCVGVFTHTTPTDAYRGAGRPEATYAIERAVDELATRLGLDPAEVRRRNFIREFPATITSGPTIDAGDYEAGLSRALELSRYAELRTEQAERRDQSARHQLGIGLSTYIEMAGFAPSRAFGDLNIQQGGWESATVSLLPDGTARVVIGTAPHGQSHETTFAQVAADELGLPPECIEILHSDTNVAPFGLDTYGSRSLAVGGVAICKGARDVVAKAHKLAAHVFEASEEDVEYERGQFTVRGTHKTLSLRDLAMRAWKAHALPDDMSPVLDATHVYDPANFSWPAGAHVAVVEVDVETGAVELREYVAVDDVGTVVNPTIVEGQIHGGLAQGIAQALYEEARYDEGGTLLTGSLLTYGVPSALELPSFTVDRTETPSPSNPLGVKGAAETGTVGAPPAVINAILDATRHLGVTNLDMPATPENVFRALSAARARAGTHAK